VRANRAVARVEMPPLGDGEGAAEAVARVVLIQRSSIDDLRKLRPPEHLGSLNQRWLALLDQGADELELMGRRVGTGRRTEAETYRDNTVKLLDRARVLVAAHGVRSCRGPAFTST
jgi:hypothetical protein